MTLEVLKALAVILEFLHEPRFLQELPDVPVLWKNAI